MKLSIFTIFLVLIVSFSVFASEIQVNTRTSLDQTNAAISIDPNGNFVVVWSSYYSNKSNEIRGRRFAADNSPIDANEFEINSNQSGNQSEPSVVTDAIGNFIVAWQGPDVNEQNQDDIFARWFDVNGMPLGDEFRINDNAENKQHYPKLAINDSNMLAIVWESENAGPEPNTSIIYCKLYDSNGFHDVNEFQVNTQPDCYYPDVAIDPNGNTTVVWLEGKRPNFTVMARLFDPNGAAKTNPIAVSTWDISSFTQPAIKMDPAGCFLITWDGDPNLSSMDDIHARIFEPNGTPLGEQFIVNTTLENAQQNPKVAMNDLGQFIIVWDSKIDPNVNERDIYARRFYSDGKPIGNEFCLNTCLEGDQKYPAIAMGNHDRFVTVWQSYDPNGSRYDLYATSKAFMGSADISCDKIVNFTDYCFLANEWVKNEKPVAADIISDNVIDLYDLSEFCYQWLFQNPVYIEE